MEYEQDESLENGGLMQRIKESPRTVSALIIILIVAAAIYAFSGEETSEQGEDLSSAEVTEETAGEESEETLGSDEMTDEEGSIAAAEDQTGETTMNEDEVMNDEEMMKDLPEAHRTESAFVEVAQAGNGVTHLARRAASQYVGENNVGYDVTAEHRIYIEDYIKDHLGSQRLSLGEEVEISFELVSQAVSAAGELSESELQSLSHYTSALN